MAGEFDPAITKLIDEINTDEAALSEKKRMVNRLCGYAGRPAMYAATDPSAVQNIGSIRTDQFYGQPLATAITTYLAMRRSSQMGAATSREIYDALISGGFKFESKDDENAIRGLRQSLTKNSRTFHKLPNGTYGLLEWYPGVKPAKAKPDDDGDDGEAETKSAGAAQTPADSGS